MFGYGTEIVGLVFLENCCAEPTGAALTNVLATTVSLLSNHFTAQIGMPLMLVSFSS